MSATSPRAIKAYAAIEPGVTVQPFEYVSRPLGDDDVEIAISHCGVCGTDVHTVAGSWGTAGFPVVPGHEIVGSITAVGPAVTDLTIGDRVGVGGMVLSCNTCEQCLANDEPLCTKCVTTYNGVYPDGAKSYGGFAEAVRVNSKWAFKIPSAIPSDYAAPLLCAGVTVYKPLKEHVQPGQRVGVVGIGGLGHMALQFIKAMDAVPVAFSQSADKEQSARELGAQGFVLISDPDSLAKASRSVDLLLVTADAINQPYDSYLGVIKTGGKLVMLGVPDDQIKISPVALLVSKVNIVGSAIGGKKDITNMLELAAKKNVRPIIQKMAMSEASKGIALVDQGKARYRVVLEN